MPRVNNVEVVYSDNPMSSIRQKLRPHKGRQVIFNKVYNGTWVAPTTKDKYMFSVVDGSTGLLGMSRFAGMECAEIHFVEVNEFSEYEFIFLVSRCRDHIKPPTLVLYSSSALLNPWITESIRNLLQ